MKVLVVGKGGREHALIRALKLSPSVDEVHAVPGSVGIALEATCHKLEKHSAEELCRLVRSLEIDLVVIGPENELVQGWADQLRDSGIAVFGPSRRAAQLEGSKVFSKEFMLSAGIPTAKAITVSSVDQTLTALKDFTPPYVLKADGLAAGKGVYICETIKELEAAAKFLFDQKGLGEAGAQALLEQFQPGWETSFLILTNGVDFQALPLAQDHKRLNDGDKGPNTGGMGVVAPLEIPASLRAEIESKIVLPSLKELQKRELLYRGVLYIGLMITDSGPSVIEYNVRWGDPEAQVLLPLLDGDWGDVFLKLSQGQLSPLKWKDLFTACVVLAAEAYPESPKTGVPIVGDLSPNSKFNSQNSYFLHAGTGKNEKAEWVTAGGRVLNSMGIGSDLAQALEHAYTQAQSVTWPGLQMRKDIGSKLLLKSKK